MKLPKDQEALRNKCWHPAGGYVEFSAEEVEQSIAARFEKVVQLYPDRLALKQGDRSFTYDRLNRAANRLAHFILSLRGTAPEPIGIYLTQQSAMVAALLGILKAGKFYLPLDPTFPQARNVAVARDCASAVIVTDRSSSSTVAQIFGNEYRTVLLEDAENMARDDNPGISISGDQYAYILHTSGSTGRFKGVAEKQLNTLHEVRCYVNQIHVSHYDRLTLLHSLSFRACELHLFAALLTGACLFPYDMAGLGVSGLAAWLQAEEVTVWHSIPTAYRRMIESLAPSERFPAVRVVHLSGAPVYQSDFESFQKHFPDGSIFLHRIGATETQTISWRLMDRSTAVSPGPLPLGWAPDGKELLILDDNGDAVRFGDTGEIALKSRFIAPGYWQLPELSDEKFRLDPHSGERIYFTGDLGLMSAESGLIHLGRKDFQIKIRGYRVEPEQVERILMGHPGVKDAVVLGMTGKSGSEKLVGYFTAAQSPGPKLEALRSYLKEKLPDYMIPAGFVQLAALPLNPNGKIDRHALPAPTNLRPDLDSVYVEPSSILEQQLARIWREVLELDRVGIHDNFYDLGGDSLAATRIVAQIVQQLRLELPLRSLFQSPTVAEMAAVITAHRGDTLGGEHLERLLAKVESLSEDEAQRRLDGPRSTIVDK